MNMSIKLYRDDKILEIEVCENGSVDIKFYEIDFEYPTSFLITDKDEVESFFKGLNLLRKTIHHAD